ncbi:MAG: carboxypeptidase-like regulatory domain-containing protein [Planctomycetota bacterium]|nr:carboxypeptidase-like regulatory domain-containing protein [Planctomycetota bacterium]
MKFGGRVIGLSLTVIVILVFLAAFFFATFQGAALDQGKLSFRRVERAESKKIELAESSPKVVSHRELKPTEKTVVKRTDEATPPSPKSIEIVGRVVDSSDRGIANAQFQLVDSMPSWDYIPSQSNLAKSKSDGAFSIVVKRSELKVYIVVSVAPNYEVKALQLPVANPQMTKLSLGVIVLARCSSIRGQVVDGLGAGIPGAIVAYAKTEKPQPMKYLPRRIDEARTSIVARGVVTLLDSKSRVTSDPGGYFVIPHLTAGNWDIGAGDENFSDSPVQQVNLVQGKGCELLFRLAPPSDLTFRVRDKQNKVIQGAELTLLPLTEDFLERSNIAGYSDKNGLWRVKRCRVSELLLLVEASGYASEVRKIVPEKARGSIQEMTLSKGSIIKGRLRSSKGTGEALKSKLHFLWSAKTFGGAHSYTIPQKDRFESERFGPGTCELTIFALGHCVRVFQLKLTGNESEIDLGTIELKPLTSVRITVLDEQNQAVAGAELGATKLGINSFDSLGSKVVTNSRGRGQINVAPGLVSFFAKKDGYSTAYLDDVEVPESNGEVTIRLSKTGGSLQGQCYDSKGQLAKSGLIYLVRKGHERLHDSAAVNQDGAFQFNKVPEGLYKLLEDPWKSKSFLANPNGWIFIQQGTRTRKDFYQNP